MYAMVLGRLPFCTPFKDEYHRQRMLQQIHKGLSATHDREMQPLSAGELSRPPVKGLHEMTPTEIAPPRENLKTGKRTHSSDPNRPTRRGIF